MENKSLIGIGHVHLKVSDLDKAKEFYTKLLGFKISEAVNGYIFLTLGRMHHDLALQHVRNAKKPAPDTIGLYHFAIEAKSLKELAKLYFKLNKNNIEAHAIDHGISKTVYFGDPDGNGIEVYIDTRKERKKWQGESMIITQQQLKQWAKSNK